MTKSCCFRDCAGDGAPKLRLAITPPPAGEPVVGWAHVDCLHERVVPGLVEQLKTAPPIKY